MSKITGLETVSELPPKVLLLYDAIFQLFSEGADINNIRVSTITEKAGIGKGTVYDYFDTKEEMITDALMFHVRNILQELSDILMDKKSFGEQINCMLDHLEQGKEKQDCLIRYFHIMTDNSELSELVKKRLTTDAFEKYLPISILKQLIKQGIERGEIRSDVSLEYLGYSLFSRVMTYMMCIQVKEGLRIEPKQIRGLVYQGIMEEFCRKA